MADHRGPAAAEPRHAAAAPAHDTMNKAADIKTNKPCLAPKSAPRNGPLQDSELTLGSLNSQTELVSKEQQPPPSINLAAAYYAVIEEQVITGPHSAVRSASLLTQASSSTPTSSLEPDAATFSPAHEFDADKEPAVSIKTVEIAALDAIPATTRPASALEPMPQRRTTHAECFDVEDCPMPRLLLRCASMIVPRRHSVEREKAIVRPKAVQPRINMEEIHAWIKNMDYRDVLPALFNFWGAPVEWRDWTEAQHVVWLNAVHPVLASPLYIEWATVRADGKDHAKLQELTGKLNALIKNVLTQDALQATEKRYDAMMERLDQWLLEIPPEIKLMNHSDAIRALLRVWGPSECWTEPQLLKWLDLVHPGFTSPAVRRFFLEGDYMRPDEKAWLKRVVHAEIDPAQIYTLERCVGNVHMVERGQLPEGWEQPVSRKAQDTPVLSPVEAAAAPVKAATSAQPQPEPELGAPHRKTRKSGGCHIGAAIKMAAVATFKKMCKAGAEFKAACRRVFSCRTEA